MSQLKKSNIEINPDQALEFTELLEIGYLNEDKDEDNIPTTESEQAIKFMRLIVKIDMISNYQINEIKLGKYIFIQKNKNGYDVKVTKDIASISKGYSEKQKIYGWSVSFEYYNDALNLLQDYVVYKDLSVTGCSFSKICQLSEGVKYRLLRMAIRTDHKCRVFA